MAPKYAVVSLPLGAFDSNDKEDAISAISATISDNATVLPFNVPEFKIGTLDALVQQADDLTKLEATAEAVVTKVAESLRTILNGDEDRLASYKMVNDSQCAPEALASEPPAYRAPSTSF
jgi:V-type H+-transporting ATPase subunit C